mmetsp:Transcript_79380/g.199436  ORF Transcript_79380/g.199436 Transcript_79380/m.199436 type:complete len:384 (-) Transcript_79380:360-1511(-)
MRAEAFGSHAVYCWPVVRHLAFPHPVRDVELRVVYTGVAVYRPQQCRIHAVTVPSCLLRLAAHGLQMLGILLPPRLPLLPVCLPLSHATGGTDLVREPRVHLRGVALGPPTHLLLFPIILNPIALLLLERLGDALVFCLVLLNNGSCVCDAKRRGESVHHSLPLPVPGIGFCFTNLRLPLQLCRQDLTLLDLCNLLLLPLLGCGLEVFARILCPLCMDLSSSLCLPLANEPIESHDPVEFLTLSFALSVLPFFPSHHSSCPFRCLPLHLLCDLRFSPVPCSLTLLVLISIFGDNLLPSPVLLGLTLFLAPLLCQLAVQVGTEGCVPCRLGVFFRPLASFVLIIGIINQDIEVVRWLHSRLDLRRAPQGGPHVQAAVHAHNACY